ncbi:MAG TPA: glutathione peroxidase [Terracidiphilus sp.]|nr:glutathione peroxidase [Terracidiphilus sp.]
MARNPLLAAIKMTESNNSIYAFTAELLNGRTISLDEFRGNVLLIVNTASKCGFTPQYAGLEALYRQYRDCGLKVLGFPCNQFGRQEPGTAGEIAAFCESSYGVSFPIFSKIDVNGKNAHPLFKFLNRQKPASLIWLLGDGIRWNFTKFLIGRDGRVEARFAPSVEPARLGPNIEALLGAG